MGLKGKLWFMFSARTRSKANKSSKFQMLLKPHQKSTMSTTMKEKIQHFQEEFAYSKLCLQPAPSQEYPLEADLPADFLLVVDSSLVVASHQGVDSHQAVAFHLVVASHLAVDTLTMVDFPQ